uniref:BTB domain-containing protein n=1 Tax=Panagrolaimus davidi TaxID=227884 RepID=A0A914P1M4_9BILA
MSDKTYADVVLFSSTGKEILTYRCILAKFSKFFKTIFDETKELPVQCEIEEFDTETIIAALNFCYGKNDVIKNNEKKLFEFAEKYCIEELKESCCTHFADNLSTENVCDIIQIAYSNNFEELKQKCKKLMTEKKAEIDQTKLKALSKDILFDVYF